MNNLSTLIKLALAEDLGMHGDITTKATVDKNQLGIANLKAKQTLVVAGADVAKQVFLSVDPELNITTGNADGIKLKTNDNIFSVSGKLTSILAAERVALNFLQHLTGIATLTRRFVDQTKGYNAKILDTRKTTPGFRALEKQAVLAGGGNNHRFGLFDRYLLKENHLAAAGSISSAVQNIRATQRENTLVEIEVKNEAELAQALKVGVDIIMLDNMTPQQVANCTLLNNGNTQLEVSGNINLENVLSYAQTGVDFISIGSITHSAPAADISLLLE